MLKYKFRSISCRAYDNYFFTNDKNAQNDASVFNFSKVMVFFFNCKDLRNVVE